jgi:hypothetical protein
MIKRKTLRNMYRISIWMLTIRSPKRKRRKKMANLITKTKVKVEKVTVVRLVVIRVKTRRKVVTKSMKRSHKKSLRSTIHPPMAIRESQGTPCDLIEFKMIHKS